MRWLVLFSLLLMQTPPLPSEQARDVVQAVAAAMRDEYVDPETGRRIARLLETKHAGGEFNGLGAAELATALTQLLRGEARDLHLSVGLVPASGSVEGVASPAARRRGGEPGSPPAMVGRVEMLPEQVGYLEVRNFSTDNVAEFDKAMAALQGAQGLIIDLRQCPGGGPAAVRHLSSYFFSKPTHLVSTMVRGREKPSERWTFEDLPAPRLAGVPIYVLTSRRTFSAGESFAFGLKVTGRAVLVGERTGGGGNIGNLVPLPHGFRMFVSIGRTYDPRTGRGWESDGIRPDVEVPAAEALEAALERYRQQRRSQDGGPGASN